MAYSKFSRISLFVSAVTLTAFVALQGCSSDDPQETPQTGAGAGGKANGGAGGKVNGGAGKSNGGADNGGDEPTAGTGNEGGVGDEPGEGGAGGEAPTCATDGFLVPCDGEGECTTGSFDNKTLTKIVDGKLPPLP